MLTPGRSTWKRSSPTGSGRIGSVATAPEPEVARFSWVGDGGTVGPRASRFVEQLAQLLLLDHQLALQAVVELLELLLGRAGVRHSARQRATRLVERARGRRLRLVQRARGGRLRLVDV